jgi:hypothetical protein
VRRKYYGERERERERERFSGLSFFLVFLVQYTVVKRFQIRTTILRARSHLSLFLEGIRGERFLELVSNEMYGGTQTWIKIELMPLYIELHPVPQNNKISVMVF